MPLSYYHFNYRIFFLRNIHALTTTPQSTTPQQYCVRQVVTDGSKCGFKLYCMPQNTAMISVNTAILIIVRNNHFLNIISPTSNITKYNFLSILPYAIIFHLHFFATTMVILSQSLMQGSNRLSNTIFFVTKSAVSKHNVNASLRK